MVSDNPTHVLGVNIWGPLGEHFATDPHRVRCNDNITYVVKFAQNPQGIKALINEYVCARLAKNLDLPIPDFSLVHITQELINVSIKNIKLEDKVQPGIHFGSRELNKAIPLTSSDLIEYAENKMDIAKIILFDHIIANEDRCANTRNLLFDMEKRRITIIDHSHAFELGCIWDAIQLRQRFNTPFRVYNLKGATYSKLIPYIEEHSFYTMVDKISNLSRNDIESLFNGLPDEWFCPDEDKEALTQYLYDRITRVDELMEAISKALKQNG